MWLNIAAMWLNMFVSVDFPGLAGALVLVGLGLCVHCTSVARSKKNKAMHTFANPLYNDQGEGSSTA